MAVLMYVLAVLCSLVLHSAVSVLRGIPGVGI